MAAKRACLKLVSDVLTKEEMLSMSQIGSKPYTHMRTDRKKNSFKLQPEARGRHALNEEKKQAIRSFIMSPENSTKISHDHKIDAVSRTHTKLKVFRDHKQAIQKKDTKISRSSFSKYNTGNEDCST